MGKPYNTEMEKLDDSYKWAINAPIESLSKWISSSINGNLISVGSGGSYTAAMEKTTKSNCSGRKNSVAGLCSITRKCRRFIPKQC